MSIETSTSDIINVTQTDNLATQLQTR